MAKTIDHGTQIIPASLEDHPLSTSVDMSPHTQGTSHLMLPTTVLQKGEESGLSSTFTENIEPEYCSRTGPWG